MKRIVFVLLIASIPATGAWAGSLTLDQALQIAMEKNRDIDSAREYTRYVQGRYVAERAAALPRFGINAGYDISRDNGQPAVMGGESTLNRTSAGLTLSQTLYSWGKISAGIRAAEEGIGEADEGLRMARQAAWRDVSVSFHDVLFQRELNRFALENLSQKQRHADEAHKRFAAGVATDYDVLSGDVAVENARPETIRTENNLRIARERLRFLLAGDDEGLDVEGSLAVTRQPVPDYAAALKRALEKRPELAGQRHRIGIYRELVAIAAAENKPSLDLKAGTGWGSQESDTFSASGGNWNVGVALTFPFFDGYRTAGRVQQAESELATRQIEEKKLVDAISLEVRTSLSNLREADEILTALSGTVRQAEKLLQMAEKGYEYGVKISLEVDDAQLNLLQARISLARASRDYLTARVNLDWATGVAGEAPP